MALLRRRRGLRAFNSVRANTPIEKSMKKFISVIAACIGASVSAAGIALPSASADPTNAPDPGPTVSNEHDRVLISELPGIREGDFRDPLPSSDDQP